MSKVKTLPEILEQAISESATDDLSTDWDAIQEEAQEAIAKELMGCLPEKKSMAGDVQSLPYAERKGFNDATNEVRARLTAFIGKENKNNV